jgi:hypothetical protein
MKPLICTKTHPEMPVSFDSSSSCSPLQADESAFRLSKLSGDTATACTLHVLLLSSYKAHGNVIKPAFSKPIRYLMLIIFNKVYKNF